MITSVMTIFIQHQIVINFVSYFFIFLGTFYVALHNRKMPQWAVCPLWYVGLFSLLTCVTIICQWAIGPEHPLSYWNLGQLTQSLVYVTLAIMSVLSLAITVKKDISESKKRSHED